MSELQTRIFSLETPISDKEFEQFYALMELSFPKSERRSRKGFLELCKKCPYYKIYTLFDNQQLIAFLTVWEFEEFTFGDHFAVLPQLRNGGVGSKLLSWVKNSSKTPFIIEVELPETEISQRRINFYLRHGFIICDFDYLLPPMQEGCSALPMKIMSYPALLTKEQFEPLKKLIYNIVYEVDNI